MAATTKSKLPLILGIVFAFLLLCCGGFGALTCWGVKKGFDSAAELKPVAQETLQKMSDSNYDFAAVRDSFDSQIFSGSEAEDFQRALNQYRDKLGKFKSVGAVKGFSANVNNGVSTRAGTFDVEFEKGSGTLELNTRIDGSKFTIIGFHIKSTALD